MTKPGWIVVSISALMSVLPVVVSASSVPTAFANQARVTSQAPANIGLKEVANVTDASHKSVVSRVPIEAH